MRKEGRRGQRDGDTEGEKESQMYCGAIAIKTKVKMAIEINGTENYKQLHV